jgi:hypothetical protein
MPFLNKLTKPDKYAWALTAKIFIDLLKQRGQPFSLPAAARPKSVIQL